MSCGGQVVVDQFWEDWIERFERTYPKYLTPQDKVVQMEVSKAGVMRSDTEEEKACKIWDHVVENVTYKLSKTWYTPEQTIANGVGDCEDVTFLISSMLLASDVEGHYIKAGQLGFPDGRSEEHTWVELNGAVIDGTGPPDKVEKLCYTPVEEWQIQW